MKGEEEKEDGDGGHGSIQWVDSDKTKHLSMEEQVLFFSLPWRGQGCPECKLGERNQMRIAGYGNLDRSVVDPTVIRLIFVFFTLFSRDIGKLKLTKTYIEDQFVTIYSTM